MKNKTRIIRMNLEMQVKRLEKLKLELQAKIKGLEKEKMMLQNKKE